MSEPYLGEIRLFPYTFAPRGWAFCAGQLMGIAQNSALYSLLGVTYGGNGTTTFGIPDLRGKVAISSGQSPGFSPYTLGEVAGVENVTLLTSQMPAHNHLIVGSQEDAGAKNPNGQVLATPTTSTYNAGPFDATMAPQSISVAGGSQPHENMQPYLVLNYCIALVGVFPSRN